MLVMIVLVIDDGDVDDDATNPIKL